MAQYPEPQSGDQRYGLWTSLGVLVLLPIVLVKVFVFFLYALIVCLWYYVVGYPDRRRRIKRLQTIKNSGGFLRWTDIIKELQLQDSSFVIYPAPDKTSKLWWTQVDVLAMYRAERNKRIEPLSNWPKLIEGWTDPDFCDWLCEKLEASPAFPAYLTEPPADSEFPLRYQFKIDGCIRARWPEARVTTINLSMITPTADIAFRDDKAI